MKIVINSCYGGFGLSEEALKYIGIKDCYDIERNDPRLIECVRELGEKADSRCAKLKIVEIPDDVEWQVEEYDGIEWIAEKHETWR